MLRTSDWQFTIAHCGDAASNITHEATLVWPLQENMPQLMLKCAGFMEAHANKEHLTSLQGDMLALQESLQILAENFCQCAAACGGSE